MMKALQLIVGSNAAKQLEQNGWNPDLFDLVIGASGGPKWFILGHLDRLLFGEFFTGRKKRLDLLGSSVGSWRHACASQPRVSHAYERMESAYIYQDFGPTKPSVEEITSAAAGMLAQSLGSEGHRNVAEHRIYNNHIVTARALTIPSEVRDKKLLKAMLGVAMSNSIDRGRLQKHFQRVIFSNKPLSAPKNFLRGFETQVVPLCSKNAFSALMASGSIPMILKGERDIYNAPKGHYWDGGIIDYHFDLAPFAGDGLVLYPHFTQTLTQGWFDKFLPWRANRPPNHRNVVMLCPTTEFVADLPYQKIPDRRDFQKLTPEARIEYWQTCVERSKALADEFNDLRNNVNPLKGAIVLPDSPAAETAPASNAAKLLRRGMSAKSAARTIT